MSHSYWHRGYVVNCVDDVPAKVNETKEDKEKWKAKALNVIVRTLKRLVHYEIEKANAKSKMRYVCSSCEYKWETKKMFGQPFKCPRCNSQKIITFDKLSPILSYKKRNQAALKKYSR